jgi:hypothetical protein
MNTKTNWFQKAAAIAMIASAGSLTVGALPAMADDGPSIDTTAFFDTSLSFPVDTSPVDTTVFFDTTLSFPVDTPPVDTTVFFDTTLSFPVDTPPVDTTGFFDTTLSFPIDTPPVDTTAFLDNSLAFPIGTPTVDTAPMFDPSLDIFVVPSPITDLIGETDLTLLDPSVADPSVSLDFVAVPMASNTDPYAGEVLLASGLSDELKRCLAIAGMTIALCKGVQGLPDNPANIPSLPPGNVPSDVIKADEERKKREKEAADAAASGDAKPDGKPNEFIDGLGNAFNVVADGAGKFFVIIGGIVVYVFLGPFGWAPQ